MSFVRLEFQDGKRKASTEEYQGSGRAHAYQLGQTKGGTSLRCDWTRSSSRRRRSAACGLWWRPRSWTGRDPCRAWVTVGLTKCLANLAVLATSLADLANYVSAT